MNLVAGMLVLAGAMAAGQQRRIYESVLLKMLGGRRRDIALSFLWEFALLALSAAAIALLVGSVGAWFFLNRVMETDFVFSAAAAFGVSWAHGRIPARRVEPASTRSRFPRARGRA